ncbi:MAG: glycosyltransferase family 4 protein [Gaiellaceae bacterium]
MRVLITTSMYPSPERPFYGTFVRTQVEAIRELGIDVRLEVIPEQGTRAGRYLHGLRNIRRAVASGEVDLVHAHYSYVGAIARLQRSVPTVVTYHGGDLHGSVADASGRYAFRGKVVVASGRLLANFVDAAIVQSDEMAAKLRPRDRVYVVPHEVDTQLFRPVDRSAARAELGLDSERGLILFPADPGRKVKRFGLAVDAHQLLRSSGRDAELLVVHREPQDRLNLYMNACDALVLTSFHEGSPNVVKQAMACNLPVVATDVGDVRKLVAGTQGCHVCAPVADDFADALASLLDNPRRTDGRPAVEHLTKRHVAERIAGVYERVLRGRASAEHDVSASSAVK